MSNHSSESTLNVFKTQSPGTCSFLKLPLELRDIIYGMLLATPYCKTFEPKVSFLKFHLHTPILLVNKQVSAEATRVLYHGNDFIILKTIGMSPLFQGSIPVFKLLSEEKIPSPVLRIDIALADASDIKVGNAKTQITTPEALPSIISNIWWQQENERDKFHPLILSLTLDFSFKAASRYEVLSELVQRPWEKITGVKELVLTGDIKQSMREHLERSNLQGPFPNDAAAHLMEYNSLAERALEHKDCDAARWWWIIMNEYWIYVSLLSSYRERGRRTGAEDNGLRAVLQKSPCMYYKGTLKLMKACLRDLKYKDVVRYFKADINPCGKGLYEWEFLHVARGPPPLMQMKFSLCAALARTALGETRDGMENISWAADTLYSRCGRGLNMNMSLTELTEDLKSSVDNELIHLKSPWRCGRRIPPSPAQQSGPHWQASTVRRSFWEWLELPDRRR